MTNDKLEALKAAARAATPQNIDTAEHIDRFEDGSHIECPACGGEGSVEFEADFCNYDGHALGVQFYGIGKEHGAAEAYFRAASPANVIALVDRLERAESRLDFMLRTGAVVQWYGETCQLHGSAGVISGAGEFYDSAREAIDAAMAREGKCLT